MNWIEDWLGFAPDNGDGSLELLLAISAIAVALLAALAARRAWRGGIVRFFEGSIAGQSEAPAIGREQRPD